MAANLSEFYSHRRMEDITNRHKKHKLDKRTCYPMQERLPSPSSPCSPPQKQRTKSVLFVLNKNQLYEASPLLTPKDEDDEEDEINCEYSNYDLACRDEAVSKESELEQNPDYIALSSTLNLLTQTKEAIRLEILSLLQLKTRAHTASKLDLVAFYVELICGQDKSLPKQHRVMSAPNVQWSRYHPEMASVSVTSSDTTNDIVNDSRLFKTLLMFQQSP